jgi:cholesterol transport system auxiliary component
MSAVARRILLAGLALAPAACSGLLPQGSAPPKLYRLTPVSEFPPRGPRLSGQILVDVPASTAALDSDRIALSRSPVTLDYFADAAWTDRAPLMVQSLIVQSFENSARVSAIARESLALKADYVLLPELRHFEAEYADAGPPAAHIQIGLKRVKMPERAIAGQQSFEARKAASENQMPAIVDAFNAALHEVMGQIVQWALTGAG